MSDLGGLFSGGLIFYLCFFFFLGGGGGGLLSEFYSITTPLRGDASPTQGTQHEATRNITTPPWMGC